MIFTIGRGYDIYNRKRIVYSTGKDLLTYAIDRA